MKKIFLIGIVIMLAFASACSKPAEDVINTGAPETNDVHTEENTFKPTAATTEPPEETPPGGNDVPEQIFFNSIEEYREFAASLELDDAEFEKFIGSGHYSVNGVYTREDVIKALNALGSVPFPEIDGFVFDGLCMRYDLDTVVFDYVRDGETRQYLCFDINITCSYEDAESFANASNCELINIPIGSDSELKYLLWAVKNDDSNPNSYYFTNIRSHSIRLTTNLPVEELLNALNGCQYTTIDEYAEKTA